MSTPGPGTAGARLPALDGLRGLALAGMLAWHAEVGWVRGGFARMTVFFVLAGFLAARSLARLRARGVDRAFASFWRRRVFRLLPMTLVGVAWAVAVTAAIGGSRARGTVTGDALSVLASVSNWRFILDDRPYGALFEAPNAFQHYWSLAVEEQSFLLLPLILAAAGGLAAAAGRRGGDPARLARRTVWVLVALAAALAGIPAVVTHPTDVAYYGTHVRLGEFVAGVALAVALPAGEIRARTARARRAWDAAGLVSLAVLVAVMLTVERDHEWLYRGGMGLFAIPAVILVGAIVHRGRAVSAVLGAAPLAALGRWALSIYVLHWPLFLLMNRAAPRLGLAGARLEAAKVAGGVALGAAGYLLVERPLMSARASGAPGHPLTAWWSRDRVAARVLAGVAAACALAAVAVPPRDPVVDLDAAVGEGPPPLSAEEAEQILTGAAAPALPVFRDPDDLGVALFGGSGALMLALGEETWADQHPSVESVSGYTPLSCGLLTRGERRGREGNRSAGDEGPKRPPEECLEWTKRWPAVVKKNRIDVAVVVASTYDLNDWRLDADPEHEWRHVGDPILDPVLERSMHVAADVLRGGGAREVVFVTVIEPPPGADSDENRRRASAHNAIMRRVAAGRDDVRLIDYGTWTARLDRDEFDRLLPDGIHTTHQSSAELWDGWLGDSLEAAVPLIPRRRAL